MLNLAGDKAFYRKAKMLKSNNVIRRFNFTHSMAVHLAVILTDANKKILWVNDDFTVITGYSLSEVVGRKPSLLQGRETNPETIKRLRKAIEAQVPFKDEVINYRKNGEKYLCKLVIHPIFDDDKQLINFIAFEMDGTRHPDDRTVPLMNLEERYRTSSLRGQEGAKLFYRLKTMIADEQLYLQPGLTLKSLADTLDTNTKYLSQVVNFHSGQNLQVFINTFRVNEAKEKMQDEKNANHTLYGIAMQCGFKNKSTFYKVFKQQTGLTPLEFIKSAKLKEKETA